MCCLTAPSTWTAFGYDTVPYQRNRVLPGRELGDTPFNITTPRYDEYYRNILGFPQTRFYWRALPRRLPERAKIKRVALRRTTWPG